MTEMGMTIQAHGIEGGAVARGRRSVVAARVLFLVVIAAASVIGFLATSPDDVARATADADLTRLLRAMTGLKLMMAAIASGAVLWRLGSPATPAWLCAYAVAGGAMFGGPGLIWGMAHVAIGAFLLHAGLLATIVLVWRDPVVGRRLEALIAARRSSLRRAASGDHA
jgi:hypothetical protein